MQGFLPVNIDIRHQHCVIAGGGAVALRKAKTLLQYGANVTIIAPDLLPAIRELEVELREKQVNIDDFEGCFLAILATDDCELNLQLSKELKEKGVPVNSATGQQESTLTFPALLQRGDLTIAVSTDGKSPFLSRKLRDKIKQLFPEEYETFITLFGTFRDRAIGEISDPEKRKMFYQELYTYMDKRLTDLKNRNFLTDLETIFKRYKQGDRESS